MTGGALHRGGLPAGANVRAGGDRAHVLAVDIGTSSTRVSAVSPEGEILAGASLPARGMIDGDRAELDAESVWSDLCGLIAGVTAEVGQPAGVGVSSQLGTVLVGADLAPVGPTLLWQDRRAAVEAAELAGTLDGRDGELAGRSSAAELAAPRLMWIARHRPDDWTPIRWVLSLKDFVVARLTGSVATDPTTASYSLLFAVADGSWSDELAGAAGVPPEWLPPVLAADALVGTVEGRASADTGLRAGVPVAVGGPDGTVGALGSGAVSSGITVDVGGTTDVLLHTLDRPLRDPERGSVLNAFLFPGLWTIGGPTGMTGGGIAWLCSVLGYESTADAYGALGSAVAALPPGAGGLSFHTALTGERFPTWSTARTGSVSGLRPEHTAAHLLRAAEEGAAFEVREGLEALAALGIEVGEIRVSGGMSTRREAMQLRANVWGRPVVAVSAREATTVGAAVLAAVCSGVHGSAEEAVASMVTHEPAIEPEPKAAADYEGAYLRWQLARPADDRTAVTSRESVRP